MTQPSASRRRGDNLEHAIFDAALKELAEVGYANFQMERVAARARAGKASLYKRWPSRALLVLATSRYVAETKDLDVQLTGDVRTDLIAVLRRIADLQAGPYGEVIRGLISEWPGRMPPDEDRSPQDDDPGLPLRDARSRVITQILRAGVEQGSLRSESLAPRVIRLGPVLVTHHFLIEGRPPGPTAIEEIVDTILMPIITK